MADGKSIFTSQGYTGSALGQQQGLANVYGPTKNPFTQGRTIYADNTLGGYITREQEYLDSLKSLETRIELLECQLQELQDA